MKKIFIITYIIISNSCFGQKIALLNRDFKQPILYTDSVTVQQLSLLFPVSSKDFDTLYANLNYIHAMLKIRRRAKMKSFELRSGSTIIRISRVPLAYGDRYLVIAKTNIGEVESQFNLAPADRSNAKNAERIEKLMVYLKTNKDLFKSATEIHPKIYNVVAE
jgi:hypothetical protein